ncbi:hypothetical protein SAMD00019534_061770 [Acytostelium subglobosum LB1]|uniref:hypothetical protein n=1 Tax=Acytostelium subglobosum LB1 TaxID=1410327 RepID=UPI0006450A16|nr:hypothetical protein SAMD00019534_061770 [Acytostelium subglobosum LB1]GAM23002.1 hypothetical protein SAMD00019534_061770 [Acytostelium subglobosum LB1]|eukprot:XP_012754229.1 hypothetical protein SAMD00019534_061770 [Acytostelium subglobosum LB1]
MMAIAKAIIEPSVKLISGHKLPLVGFGTWKSEPNTVGEAVKAAIRGGCRHIDCAAAYQNEKEVGLALKEMFTTGVVKREELFITSKLYNTCHEKHNVRKHCEITLNHLGLEYLDLYLVHWPVAFEYTGESLDDPMNDDGSAKVINVPLQVTWQEMEALVDDGLTKSIGVSNYNVQTLNDLLTYCRIKPAVNQVELHPYNTQPLLKWYCERNDIHLTAYSPLGSGQLVNDPKVAEIAIKYDRSVSNILCRWAIQHGFSVIPKSVTPSRITENLSIVDFTISDVDMEQLNALNKSLRTCDPADFWGLPMFS